MNYSLPYSVCIDGKELKIRNNGDYRVILDCIEALQDPDLSDNDKIICALMVFYENFNEITNPEEAVREMYNFIRLGESNEKQDDKPPIMNWSHDFPVIVTAINRVLGYDVRTPDKFTHFFTFIGAYMEIGECLFSTIISIRTKRSKGQKLEKWELDFLRENREKVELPKKLSSEEQIALNEKW